MSRSKKNGSLVQRLFSIGLSIGVMGMSLTAPITSIAGELEIIRRRGKLIVGVKDNLRPLGFYDEEGNLQGLEIDLARGLAKEILGSSDAVILKPIANQERLEMVIDRQVDLVIAGVTATSSRDRVAELSVSYYLDGTGLVTKLTSIENLNDLSTSKIAVLEGSSTIAVVRSALPKSKLIAIKSYREALDLLENGLADAFASDFSILAGWIQEYPQYRLLQERLATTPLAVLMPEGLQYARLRLKVNKAIENWRRSGWLKQRAIYWGLPLKIESSPKTNSYE